MSYFLEQYDYKKVLYYFEELTKIPHGSGNVQAISDYLVNFAEREGFYNLTLNVWECNEGAKRFYEKCGLIPQKTEMETIL